ncbi:MAG: antibiotic biosynthesis monooxygenase [Chitinophagaceae bacterium]|nr:MAG: antibiotic biosynthesis monooxygenase [Chitinophagaceae bacterium]
MIQQTVFTHAQWKVKDGQLDEVLSILKEVAEKSLAEEGNLFYKIHQSIPENNVLVLYEGYKDQAAADSHRSSAHFQDLVIGRIIPLLEKREVIQMHQII